MAMCQIPKWSGHTEEEILAALLKGREETLAGYEDVLLDEFYRVKDGGIAVIGTMTEKSTVETVQQLVHFFPASFLMERRLGRFLKNYRTIRNDKHTVTGMIERCADLEQVIRLGASDVDLLVFCNDPGNPFYTEEDRRFIQALRNAAGTLSPEDLTVLGQRLDARSLEAIGRAETGAAVLPSAGETILELPRKKLTRKENAAVYLRLCRALELEED